MFEISEEISEELSDPLFMDSKTPTFSVCVWWRLSCIYSSLMRGPVDCGGMKEEHGKCPLTRSQVPPSASADLPL